jgi:predicted ABC-type ATPase
VPASHLTSPSIIAIAGPNGAGKTTFYNVFLKKTGLPFLNADLVAAERGIDSYAAARLVELQRYERVKKQESFIFETVFSDPAGAKISFLKDAVAAGYIVELYYIGISDPIISEKRVTMRVKQGGHNVPLDKLKNRFPRTLENLKKAIAELPCVFIFDNDNLARSFRKVAEFRNGIPSSPLTDIPEWLQKIVSS